MQRNLTKRFFSLLLALTIVVGLAPVSVSADPVTGTPGESAENPISISTMEQLIEEMEKDVNTPTYYKLTEDISHETNTLTINGSDWMTDEDGFTTVRVPEMAQCVVGTGKKFLELDGHDIHYKNNVNFNHANNSKYYVNGKKYDSLTFFYLGEGCDLTVSNTTGDDAEVWYDGWMHNRTNLFFGPNYIYTAVRDVFRVEKGAELTVNNTDIEAGRNRKIWMVNSFYLDKDKETNLIVELTWNGFAYEQIYGSAIVANGGKVTINGGYIEGRGGERNEFNVTGLQDWDTGNVSGLVGDWTTDDMIENCLSNVGAKAAVQIAGEGSTVIINGGEFWGYGGANVIGINTLNGRDVNQYTLRINAGTFDTSKTDKERVPDRNAGSVNDGPWSFSALVWDFWANCRAIRDTLRGNIGIPAVDGYGKNVFNTKMVHVYIDDEEPEDECIENDDLDFRYKTDSDTIIVKPREEKAYWSTETHTWSNYADRAHYQIYAYLKGEEIGGKTLYYRSTVNPTLYFSAESHYDLTDADNPYFDRGHLAICHWTLYEEDKDGNLINTYPRTSAPFHTEHKEGHTVFNFKIPLSNFTDYSDVDWNEDHKYYMVAHMEERFGSNVNTYVTHSYTTGAFQDWENGVYDGDGVLDFYYSTGLKIVYGQSLATCGAEVVYSNAVYDSDPVLTFNDAFNEMIETGSEVYQWQVLEDDKWVDHGNLRNSPELAVEALLKHKDVTGKQVRLKITPDYCDKLPIYSNVCTVQKSENTRWPDLGTFSCSEDLDHSGRYILNTNTYNDWLELLICPYDSDRDLSALDWSKATSPSGGSSVVFDDLEIGVYTVYARFKETVDYEAGTEIGYSKVVVGPYTAPTGTNVLYDGKPVTEIFVKQYEEFELEVAPLPDNATLNSTNVTTWVPDTEKSNIIQYYTGSNGLYAPFNQSRSGRTIEFMAVDLGYVTFEAQTTLPNGTSSVDTITVRVVPDDYIPYTVSVVNRGAKVIEGGSFMPQVALHARVAMLTQRRVTETEFEAENLLDSQIKVLLQSPTIKNQLRDRLTWALVNPFPQSGMSPFITSTAKASINNKTGEITLKADAVAEDVIEFVGILNDPYLGQIIIPGSITVAAAEPHVHDYEGYAKILNDTEKHFRVCECGQTITEAHSFTSHIIEDVDKTFKSESTCPCGYMESGSVEITIEEYIHLPEYAYDSQNHWKICPDEDCTEVHEEKSPHSFTTVTDSSGKEARVCTVCGYIDIGGTVTLRINVTSYGSADDGVTLQLIREGETDPIYTGTNKGNSASFTLTNVAVGMYTMRLSKSKHVPREYTLVVEPGGATITAK